MCAWSAKAGRTNTRVFCDRPQPRWDEGIELARSLNEVRDHTLRGTSPLSLNSRIQIAKQYLREFFGALSFGGHSSNE